MSEIKEIREKVKSLHVLVVDDEEKILQGTKLFLKKFFKDVDVAENGEIALEMFKNNSNYDIIITDIKMPKMSGLELIEKIRTVNKEIFIAAMTGSPEEKNAYIEYLDIFLEKPVNIANMIKLMHKIIEKKGL